jgi:hypothetical protein
MDFLRHSVFDYFGGSRHDEANACRLRPHRHNTDIWRGMIPFFPSDPSIRS